MNFNFRLSLPENVVERQEIAKGQSLADFRHTVLKLKDRFLPYHEGLTAYNENIEGKYVSLSRLYCEIDI